MIVAATDAKIVTKEQAVRLLAGARAEGQRIVLTNGVFDLLHTGHVRYLQEARALGDLLVVALNDDQSVRRLKGPARPLVALEDRAVVVSALECVDLVVSFSDDTAETVVARLQPDVYVKGGDYSPKAQPGQKGYLPEAPIVQRYGGQVVVLCYLPGHSTTDLIRRLLESHAAHKNGR